MPTSNLEAILFKVDGKWSFEVYRLHTKPSGHIFPILVLSLTDPRESLVEVIDLIPECAEYMVDIETIISEEEKRCIMEKLPKIVTNP